MSETSPPPGPRPDPDKLARLVLESADDFAIFTTNLDGLITSWSAGAERLLGWREAELLSEDSCIIFTREDLAAGACAREREKAREEGRAEDERWHLKKDGSRFFASGLLMRLEEAGEHIGYIKILRDRTERHEADEERLELHRQSAEILESLSDAFYAVDAEWRFTYVNRRAEEWWGRDRSDLIGKVYWEEFPAAVGSIPYHAHLAAMEDREPKHLDALSPIIGRWVEIDIHPTASGGLSVYFRDISKRRAREVELEESQARLRLALDAAKMAIWELDLVQQRLTPSPELAAFLNINVGELSDIENVRARYHPDDRDPLRKAGEAALERGERSFEAEFRYYRSPDDLRWFLLRADAITSDEGQPERVLGALVDITERKAAENALRELKDHLQEEVEVRTRELLRAEEALRQSQKMEAIGQLTGGVAHDFNNLLTVIRGSADLLRRGNLSEERRQHYVEAISETADRAARLTGQLLAFARRQALKPEVFNAGNRIAGLADMLRTIVGSRIQLVVAAECEPCFVEADAVQLETALVNMTVNARDAMDGQGTLRIVVEPADALPGRRGHAEAESAFVSVSVSDTGHGIPPDQLDHIFEPFFTTKEVGKGTGLGLSQVYGFAKQSGGDVEVTSEVGVGTTFRLYLPRVDAPTVSTRTEERPGDEIRSRGHVLVVEDNEQVGAFSTQLLQEIGYETTWAANAEEALTLLDEHPERFEALFSDVVMPGMNGIDLAHEVRRRRPDLPVVLTSGYSHVLAQGTPQGFELLHKPYSVDDLNRVLQAAMRPLGPGPS